MCLLLYVSDINTPLICNVQGRGAPKFTFRLGAAQILPTQSLLTSIAHVLGKDFRLGLHASNLLLLLPFLFHLCGLFIYLHLVILQHWLYQRFSQVLHSFKTSAI